MPRLIVSWSFVSSRQTAPDRSPPQAAARSARVAATRPGASYRIVARSSAAIRASRSRRSRPERGRKPSKDQRGPASAAGHDRGQDRRRARDRDDQPALGGPGAHEVVAGIADAGRAGVGDQGEVGARPRRWAEELGQRGSAALRAWKLTRWVVIALRRQEPARVAGVLGGDQRARRAGPRGPGAVTSARLPIGVATMNSRPAAAGTARRLGPGRAGPPPRVEVVDAGRARAELGDRRRPGA